MGSQRPLCKSAVKLAPFVRAITLKNTNLAQRDIFNLSETQSNTFLVNINGQFFRGVSLKFSQNFKFIFVWFVHFLNLNKHYTHRVYTDRGRREGADRWVCPFSWLH